MLIDGIRWNMLNILRVELALDCYRLWKVIISSSIQSQRGQYAIIQLLITLFAHLSVQFNFNWLLTVYSAYLSLGVLIWLHKRVYFYHRKRDTQSVKSDLVGYESHQNQLLNVQSKANNNQSSNFGTLAKHNSNSDKGGDKNGHSSGNTGSGSCSSSLSSNSNGSNSIIVNEKTNSLQRQRLLAYKDFQKTLNEPRLNPKMFALSLTHLANISKLAADDDAFDEMHFQILATRRDVINILLRTLLIVAGTILSCN